MAPTNLVIEGYGAQISPVRPTLWKFLSNYIYQIFVIMKSPIAPNNTYDNHSNSASSFFRITGVSRAPNMST